MKKWGAIFCVLLLLGGCETPKKVAPQEGRVALVDVKTLTISADQETYLKQEQVKLQRAGFSLNLTPVCQVPIGEGISDSGIFLPQPVVVGKTIYTLDTEFQLSAFNLTDCQKKWQVQLPISKEIYPKSVGLGANEKVIFAVGGDGTVVAVSPRGKIRGTRSLDAPLRSVPVMKDGLLFLLGADNSLFVLGGQTGESFWNDKMPEAPLNYFGMPSVGMEGELVVVPYTTGDIVGYNAFSGERLWSEALFSTYGFDKMEEMTHLIASPIVSDGLVFVVGNSGSSGVLYGKTGEEVWTQPVSGVQTPVVKGNVFIMLTHDNQVIAFEKYTGHVMWQTQLDSKEMWKGPVVYKKGILFISTSGQLVYLDAKTGLSFPVLQTEATQQAPLSVQGYIILLSNEAILTVYK